MVHFETPKRRQGQDAKDKTPRVRRRGQDAEQQDAKDETPSGETPSGKTRSGKTRSEETRSGKDVIFILRITYGRDI